MMGMEGAFLEEVGAVPKADTLRRKEVQLNTRMHFTQRRCAARAYFSRPCRVVGLVALSRTLHGQLLLHTY